MRITGGELRGLVLRAPKGDRVRPTQDRVREAVFSMLGASVPGARALDLFAGTGAMGLEAASRGAAHVTWVEQDRRVAEVLKENTALLVKHPCETHVVCDEAARYLKRLQPNATINFHPLSLGPHPFPFSLVFADPPYEWVGRAGWGGIMDALAGGVLAEGGVFVAEQAAPLPVWTGEGWEVLRDRVYGGTRVCVYKKERKHGIDA